MKYGLAGLATLLVGIPSLSAQEPGTFELGGAAHLSYFDRSLSFDQGQVAPGAVLGVFLVRNLAVEAEGAWARQSFLGAGSDMSHIPIRGRLTYNLPVGPRTALLMGAGYVRTFYRDELAETIQAEDGGATAFLGARLGSTTSGLNLRIGSYLDIIPSPSNGAAEHFNWGLTAGVSYLFGRSSTPRDNDTDDDRSGDGNHDDRSGDTDHDGVRDTADHCPNTPATVAVGADGCPRPTDADGDGVSDDADGCSATAAGAQVDARGCPLPKDSDNDGVTDDKDRCAATPTGTKIDANGCQMLFEVTKAALVLEGVTFATGAVELTEDAQGVLRSVAQSLIANDSVRVEIQGHTDNSGSRAVNQRLSQARAEAVMDLLIANGVAAERLVAKGYGSAQPLASNATADGRAQNRRVELKRLP